MDVSQKDQGRGRCEGYRERTILDENVETLLDQEGSIKDDETITEREHVVAGAGFEKLANGSLQTKVRRESMMKQSALTRPSSCSMSRGLMGPLDFEPCALSRGRK